MTSFLKLVRKHIESLTRECRKLKKTFETSPADQKLYDNIKMSIEFLKEDISYIRDLETDSIVDYLYAKRMDKRISQEEYKDILNQIKIVLRGKYDNGIDFELNDTQKQFLNDFLLKLEDTKSSFDQKEKKNNDKIDKNKRMYGALEDECINCELLYENIVNSNGSVKLNLNDFDTIMKIIDSQTLSGAEKRALLVGVKDYIDSVNKNGRKSLEKMDIKTLISMLKDDYHLSNEIISLINDNKREVMQNGDLNSIKDILDYMVSIDEQSNKKNILKRFDSKTLLSIMLYGSVTSVSNRYKLLVEQGNDYSIFYTVASGWVDRMKRESKTDRKRGKKGTPTDGGDIKNPLLNSIYLPSPEEQLAIITFLQTKGFDVDITSPKIGKIVRTSMDKIVDNYNLINSYGLIKGRNLEKFPVSVLSYSSLMNACDQYIEAGLSDYMYKYTSTLSRSSEELFAVLFKLRATSVSRDEYKSKIFSTARGASEYLSGELTQNYMHEDVNDLESYLKKNGAYSFSTSNTNEYDQCIYMEENVTSITNYAIKDERLIKLEKNNKIDDNTYIFDGQLISRRKVLRNYSILEKNGLADRDDALIYAITRNSLITEETFKVIAQAVAYQKGGVK